MTLDDAMNDAELDDLLRTVSAVYGQAAVGAANDRAYDRAGDAGHGDGAIWLRVFHAAWKDELRRLITPH